MLPYLAQGAGSSLEDGAALGVLLSTANRRQDLPEILKLYEQLRKPRSSALQERSKVQVYSHLSLQCDASVLIENRGTSIICPTGLNSEQGILY